MIPPRVLAAAIGIVLLVAAVGCSSIPSEVPPTPNIETTVAVKLGEERALAETVEARIREFVAAQPTPTPHPTYIPIPTTTPPPKPAETNRYTH